MADREIVNVSTLGFALVDSIFLS